MERTLAALSFDSAVPSAHPYVSVFIPARNEAGNIPLLMEKIACAFRANALDGEVIFVDDGSTDATWNEAVAAAEQYPFIRLFRHRRTFGLTEAMRTGFRHVRGEMVVFLPADLESDPEEDIPKLLSKLNEGYDVVAGWRQGRDDGKVLASGIYNRVSRALFHLDAHDMNWIKAFRCEVLDDLHLRSDWHRFILHLAADKGYKIGEVPVNFYPRKKGKSNYGITRIPISFLDVLVVKFLMTFSRKPMLFFGGLGSLAILAALAIWTYLTILYFRTPGNMQQRPLFIFAGVIFVAGILLFIGGFLAELIVLQADRLEDLEQSLREESSKT
ncbi:MAG TPA: glycosyltransferase family 2 protein [Anaerolineae bacterium]|nr:glycosyltransferase family 2 protein [Anaerolineae bacterium]